MQIKRVLCDPVDFSPIYELENRVKVTSNDSNYKEVEEIYFRQIRNKIIKDTGFAALLEQYEAIGKSMDADLFKNWEWMLNSTQDAINSCCATSNQISQNYTNSCSSIRSNAASIREVEEVQKNINELDFEVNKKFDKMQEEINEKLNWQAICLYLTWTMIIVIGFMIYFKSFDVSVEVNNPIQNQEIILEHEKKTIFDD